MSKLFGKKIENKRKIASKINLQDSEENISDDILVSEELNSFFKKNASKL